MVNNAHVQEAFFSLLGDSNGLTQEVASKGLSACYALARDDAQQQELVNGFVAALQGVCGEVSGCWGMCMLLYVYVVVCGCRVYNIHSHHAQPRV